MAEVDTAANDAVAARCDFGDDPRAVLFFSPSDVVPHCDGVRGANPLHPELAAQPTFHPSAIRRLDIGPLAC